MANSGEVLALDNDAVLVIRLQWSELSSIDVDLQAVVVDTAGRIIDAAYYNNMKACGGKALTHSGDEAGTSGRTNKEEVRVVLVKLPKSVHMVMVLACCFNGGALKDARDASVTFEQIQPTRRVVAESKLQASSCGLLISNFVRSGHAWQLEGVNKGMAGRHFMDCLDDLNAQIVSKIPTANRKQKVAFAMDKGDVLDFGESLQSITLGLGWDVDMGEIDLDASAVLLSQSGEMVESVFFGNLASQKTARKGAVKHSGDNLTGAGDGDDERIHVQLDALGDAVHDVFFCIHIYSKDRRGRPKTFSCVANPYCRVVEGNGNDEEELCRYTLTEASNKSGLIIARLRRAPDGRWGFHALGTPSNGTMYRDSLPDIKQLAQSDPRDLQRASTHEFSLTPAAAPAPAMAPAGSTPLKAPAASEPQPQCCVLQ